MIDIELTGDQLDEYAAMQAAMTEDDVELVSEEEMNELLGEAIEEGWDMIGYNDEYQFENHMMDEYND